MTQNIFQRPIIILSAPRSGSTLLFETLSHLENIWTIGDESHAVIEHIPELSTVFRGFVSNALHAEDATVPTVKLLKSKFLDLLRDRNGIEYDKESKQPVRFLEKTPKNSLRVGFLKKAFPDAIFIYLVRDPKANISSIIDAWHSKHFLTYPNLPGFNGKWSLLLTPKWQDLKNKSITEIATQQWKVSNQSIIEELSDLPKDRWKMINYEQFIAQPHKVLADIANFIDLDIDPIFIDKFKNGLALSKYTLSQPNKKKWHDKAATLAPYMAGLNTLVKSINEHLSSQQYLSTNIDNQLIEQAKKTKFAPEIHHKQKQEINTRQVSRNSPCPCGSGKRFKTCHGSLN
ncbi:MAG: sulfotransferase [Thalassotalea sp.]|nr:sulfotransferase [Thalassotalea sp.]MDG2394569.1 sulfotransferase [Thalassotalea sp.]